MGDFEKIKNIWMGSFDRKHAYVIGSEDFFKDLVKNLQPVSDELYQLRDEMHLNKLFTEVKKRFSTIRNKDIYYGSIHPEQELKKYWKKPMLPNELLKIANYC